MSDATPAESAIIEAPQVHAPPEWRLRTWHFFIWSSAVAISAVLGDTSGQYTLYQLMGSLFAAAKIVALCAAIEGLVRRFGDKVSFPDESGDILVCFLALSSLRELYSLVIYRTWPDYALLNLRQALHTCGFIAVDGVAITLAVAFLKRSPDRWWRRVMQMFIAVRCGDIARTIVVLATTYASLTTVVQTIRWGHLVLPSVFWILVALAIAADWRLGQRRRWPHWLGFGIYALGQLQGLLLHLLIYLGWIVL